MFSHSTNLETSRIGFWRESTSSKHIISIADSPYETQLHGHRKLDCKVHLWVSSNCYSPSISRRSELYVCPLSLYFVIFGFDFDGTLFRRNRTQSLSHKLSEFISLGIEWILYSFISTGAFSTGLVYKFFRGV